MRLSILADAEDKTVEIELQDEKSISTRITINIPYDVFLTALGSRRVGQICNVVFRKIEHLGKTRKHSDLTFKISDKGMYGDERKELAKKIAQEVCPDGWEPSLHFGSQNSFFYKDGELWGHTTIFRWVDNE
jgi:hypothetical protein